MQNYRKNIAYGMYFCLAIAFFLVILFPTEQVGRAITGHLADRTGANLTYQTISLRLPNHLVMSGCQLTLAAAERSALSIDRLVLTPVLASLLAPEKTIGLAASLLNGSLAGTVTISKDFKKIRRADLTLNALSVEGLAPALMAHLAVFPSAGSLSGAMHYTPMDSPATGHVQLSISQGRFSFVNPLLAKEGLAFTEASLQANLRDKVAEISHCTLRDQGLQVNAHGNVTLTPGDLGTAVLDITGSLQVHPERYATIQKMFPDGADILQLVGNSPLDFRLAGPARTAKFSFVSLR